MKDNCSDIRTERAVFLPEGCLYGTSANDALISTYAGLNRAREYGLTAEGAAVMCDSSLNLRVALGGGLYGIIPRDEAVHPAFGLASRDIAVVTRVGKPVAFKVLRADADTGDIILSRAAAGRECEQKYLSKLRCGDIIPAVVTHLEPFGAFVDIGCGIPSLLPVDSISVSRIPHPSGRLRLRDRVRVVVSAVDSETGRISVSMRELLGTWEENAARFSAGETVSGIVRGTESYGVFVELAPNLAGLAEPPHLNEDTADIAPHEKPPAGGCRCAVYIKSIIAEKMKVKLTLVDPDSSWGRAVFAPPVYFVPEDVTHIYGWDYSPRGAHKKISVSFSSDKRYNGA